MISLGGERCVRRLGGGCLRFSRLLRLRGLIVGVSELLQFLLCSFTEDLALLLEVLLRLGQGCPVTGKFFLWEGREDRGCS